MIGITPVPHPGYGDGHCVPTALHTRGVTAVSHVVPDAVQFAHVAPACPHALSMKPASQTPAPSQHPAHVVGPHGGGGTVHVLPGLHTRPCDWQFWQAWPPDPHFAFSAPSMHVVPEQHPAQLPGPHVVAHCCPWLVSP